MIWHKVLWILEGGCGSGRRAQYSIYRICSNTLLQEIKKVSWQRPHNYNTILLTRFVGIYESKFFNCNAYNVLINAIFQ